MEKYNQFRALKAITKASLTAIFRSPQSVFFGLFFPIVLIVIFGTVSGSSSGFSIDVAMDKKADSSNELYYMIRSHPALNVIEKRQDTLEDMMRKGKITAIINIIPEKNPDGSEHYDIHLRSASASQRELPTLQALLQGVIAESKSGDQKNQYASISVEPVPGREYKLIDFYLPGMIGFSLIGSAVFGVAFLFFNLRETLVLKRLYASPIYRLNIILGETFSRIIFQIVTVIVLILFGTYFYHFTLAHGAITFIEMLLFSILGLLVFMGAGFIISSVAKNQNVIPIYSNLFMFPQYFLSGTFFTKTNVWGVDYLPLTALNDALRKISFEGAHLIDCWKQAAILGCWGILVYFIAIKVFRWE